MESLMDQYKRSCERKEYRNAYDIAQRMCKREGSDENKRLLTQAEDNLVLYNEIQEIIKSDHDDYYKVLGVSEDVSMEAIKKAFRKKVSRYHPNRTSVDGAATATRIIQRAYFDINTETKRAEYDAKRKDRQFRRKPHNGLFTERSNAFNEHFFVMRRGGFGMFNDVNSFGDVYQEFENLERGRYQYVDYNTIISELYRQANRHRRGQQPTLTFVAYFAYIFVFLLIILMCL